MERALDPKTPTADRVALIDLIGQVAPVEGLEPLTTMLRRKESDAVHLAVLNALGHYTRGEVAEVVLAEYPKLPESLRDRVRGLLCSRTVWAGRLLDAMADGRVSPKDLRRPQVLQVVQLGDPALTARLEKVWGRLPGPNSAAKVQRIAEVRGILPEGDKGDPARGRPVFQQHCAVCHSLFGEGEKIGPDLTGAERGDLDFLLTSMVDPSALIRKEYEAQTLALDDGRVLSGLIVEENEKTITLVDSQRQKIIVPKDEVQSMKPSEVSLMPEGLLDPLPDDQVRDLFRYLRSSGPPK
jgi:putative heme-binding domain-containing protein